MSKQLAKVAKMLSPEQIARLLKVDPSTIYRWLQRGVKRGDGRIKLKSIRVGSQYRVAENDLERFIGITAAR